MEAERTKGSEPDLGIAMSGAVLTTAVAGEGISGKGIHAEGIARKAPGRAYFTVKRCFDFIVAFGGLVILSPLFCIISVLIKFEDGGSVIHRRICESNSGGYTMLKFRTMVQDADNLQKYLTEEQLREYRKNLKIENDPRITRVGRVLRVTSLDELPQIINVLRNEMSLVGPRPMVKEEVACYGDEASLVLSAKPGITGYWQVNGRSDCDYGSGERQKLELYYVSHRSLRMDVGILLRTFRVVLSRKGAR